MFSAPPGRSAVFSSGWRMGGSSKPPGAAAGKTPEGSAKTTFFIKSLIPSNKMVRKSFPVWDATAEKGIYDERETSAFFGNRRVKKLQWLVIVCAREGGAHTCHILFVIKPLS